MHYPTKIISGGQTSMGQVPLQAARQLVMATEGWMLRKWMTADGPMLSLVGYGLQLSHSIYSTCTCQNVEMADTTLVLMHDAPSDGTALTLRVSIESGKLDTAVSCALPIPGHERLAKIDACRWLVRS